MEVPNKVKFRFLLSDSGGLYRKFYWFEMADGHFYWGSSYKAAVAENALTGIEGKQVTISVPEGMDKLPKLSGKYSYHMDGKTHYKFQTEDGGDVYKKHSLWILKDKIKKPIRFYTLLTRTIKHYDKFITNPREGGYYAQVLRVNDDIEKTRLYLEFFLSPEGDFPIPETIIKFNQPVNSYFTHSMSKDLILLVRYAIYEGLDDWHPDKEITIMPANVEEG